MSKRNLAASCGTAAVIAALCAVPVGTAAAASDPISSDYVSDWAFNKMVAEMSGRDTGSLWFDYYVEVLNQEIAFRETSEPFGAAGPSGPLSGFDGYINRFVGPDTGSMWFDEYVDALNRYLREKDL